MEKKAEEQAKRQAELDRRRAEELKEIQRQPVESQDPTDDATEKRAGIEETDALAVLIREVHKLLMPARQART